MLSRNTLFDYGKYIMFFQVFCAGHDDRLHITVVVQVDRMVYPLAGSLFLETGDGSLSPDRYYFGDGEPSPVSFTIISFTLKVLPDSTVFLKLPQEGQ